MLEGGNRRFRKSWRRPQILQFCGDSRLIRRESGLIRTCILLIRRSSLQNCKIWSRRHLLRNRLERFQRRAFKVILRKPLFEPSDHDEVLLTLQQPSLESRRQYQSAILGFQLANKTAPQHLLNECFPPASPARSLRQRNHFKLPTPHTTLYQSSPIYFAARTFNELPKHLQSITNLSEFKRRAQQHFLSYSCPCSKHPNRSA